MEYKATGALDQAWATFTQLLDGFPDYVPTYLMAGGTLVALGRAAEAEGVYRKGVEVAARRGDHHAKSELESALGEISNQLEASSSLKKGSR